MSPRSSDCPHVISVGGNTWQDVSDKKEQTETCDSCNAEVPNLWMCLHSRCLYVGCGESAVDHSTSHAQMDKHPLALNLSTMRIWCYMCQTEVIKSNNKPPLKFSKANVKAKEYSVQQELVEPHNDLHLHDSTSESEIDEDACSLKPRGLVGLQNLGNTCYMNAALQALSNCTPLTRFFLDCTSSIQMEKKPYLAHSCMRLIHEMWHKRQPNYVVPSSVAHGIKMVHPMFRGYSQQDTQEFLRCFMDQLHEELKQIIDVEDEDRSLYSSEVNRAQTQRTHDEVNCFQSMESSQSNTAAVSMSVSVSDTDYETCDSGLCSEQNSSLCTDPKFGNTMEVNRTEDTQKISVPNETAAASDTAGIVTVKVSNADSGCIDVNVDHDSTSSNNEDQTSKLKKTFPFLSPSKSEEVLSTEVQVKVTPIRSRTLSDTETRNTAKPYNVSCPSTTGSRERERKVLQYRSVISDVFDGTILSSVQCLTCERVSSTVETFQDLSLPIPAPETVLFMHNSKQHNLNSTSSGKSSSLKPCVEVQPGWVSWMFSWVKSWIWGPDITLQNCLSAFFSADELKGDNMYSCEKCKKLRNGVKFSEILELPEVICIHLKRFRHEFMFSSKIGSYVSFPLEDLDLKTYMHKDCKAQITKYDLFSVICHHGTAGGGHYTTYAQNASNQQWYEFDDETVSEVDPAVVTNCQAYVLFYKKQTCLDVESLREKAVDMIETDDHSSLMQFYVSKQWVNKFNTFAEPGPITNTDFLCKHGGVPPNKMSHVHDMVKPFTQSVWELLHGHYGGGPACTRLYQCETCYLQLETLHKRQQGELERFIELNDAFIEDDNPPCVYAISMNWFKQWETFVKGNESEPPGPIDNNSISINNRFGHKVLNRNSNYGQMSEDMWHFFRQFYNGGPEIIIKQEVMSSHDQ